MVDSIAIACRIAPSCNVIALLNEGNIAVLQSQFHVRNKICPNNLRLISIESLSVQNLSKEFSSKAKADRDFRNGFWLQTANRFMLLADLMASLNLENCLHLENDNVIYFDPSTKLEAFRNHARFAIPFDRSRAIPGIVWFKDAQIAHDLACYIQDRSEQHDFDVIRKFCESELFDAKPLPTMCPSYVEAKKLHVDKYCYGFAEFGGIFDAAAIGQYIGGVDPRNIAVDSRFFHNETSDLNISECKVIWDFEGDQRHLFLDMNNQHTRVLSIHAHSKDTLGVSPFNRAAIYEEKEFITGERFQEKAELTITSKEVTAFHGRENIRTNKILEIKTVEKRKLLRKKTFQAPPDDQWIDSCRNVNTFFIYTHLLEYFKKYILRRINWPFVLISHNSDDEVGITHLDILNCPYLKTWYAQNCVINHKKLTSLPIGLKNRQWGVDKIINLLEASARYKKTKLVYSNFNLTTHSSRYDAFNAIDGLSFVTKSNDLKYPNFLEELAQHQFCICPRGNGVDTHRFWEAQYLNTVPIIIKNDWTPAYSGLPILVLDNWAALEGVDLNKEYVRISSTYHNYDSLKLESYSIG